MINEIAQVHDNPTLYHHLSNDNDKQRPASEDYRGRAENRAHGFTAPQRGRLIDHPAQSWPIQRQQIPVSGGANVLAARTAETTRAASAGNYDPRTNI